MSENDALLWLVGHVALVAAICIFATWILVSCRVKKANGIVLLSKRGHVHTIEFPGERYLSCGRSKEFVYGDLDEKTSESVTVDLLQFARENHLAITIDAVEQMLPVDLVRRIQIVFEGGYLSDEVLDEHLLRCESISSKCGISFRIWMKLTKELEGNMYSVI